MKKTLLLLFATVTALHAEPKTIGVIGVKICGETFLAIADVFPDMPAAKAGIHKGDYLLKINNEDTKSFSFHDVLSRIRGTPDSEVTLTIKRVSDGKIMDITMKRAPLTVDEQSPPKDMELAP